MVDPGKLIDYSKFKRGICATVRTDIEEDLKCH